MAEYDPELFELHAPIEPRVVPPPANGHDLSGVSGEHSVDAPGRGGQEHEEVASDGP